MAYRGGPTGDSPRTLTMHTQRGATAVVTSAIGVGLLVGAFVIPLASDEGKSWIATLIMAPCGLLLSWLGLDAWVTRAELEVDDATGLVVLTVRSLLGRRAHTFKVSDVRGVVVDTSDEDARRLAIDTRAERIPLSALATGEDLESRAQLIRDFLGTS